MRDCLIVLSLCSIISDYVEEYECSEKKGGGGHVYVHNVSRYVAERYYDKPARVYSAKSQAVARWPGREKIGGERCMRNKRDIQHLLLSRRRK